MTSLLAKVARQLPDSHPQWRLARQRLVVNMFLDSKEANPLHVMPCSYSSEFVMWAIEVKGIDVESIPKWEEKELLK